MSRTAVLLVALATFFLPAVLPCQDAGNHERTLKVGDQEREYLIHIPRSYRGKKEVPLVLMLHGRGSSNRAAARHYGWSSLADKAGFIAVFPNALGRPRSWKPAWGTRTTADSVFLARLIDKVQADHKIDKDRVFMTGHSSGGIMSFSFAATHSGKVAAIGSVAGTIGWSSQGRKKTVPKPKGPVSVISFHGMADRIVPYDRERGGNAR
ncbi:MAG: CE1 family esterase, partial [Planctomycetota bacterium]